MNCAKPRQSALKWRQCGERGTSYQVVTRPSAAVPDWRAAQPIDADNSEDEEEWDEDDLETEDDLTEPEAFGPPALVLAGFYLEELAGVRAMLDKAGGQGITVIPCTPQLLGMPLGQALQQPEPRWEDAMPPNWVHGGGWGMQRMVLFSGLGLRAQGMVLQLLASSQMGDVVPLVATPDTAGRLLGQVLAEAFQAYRKRGPAAGVDLPGGGQRRFVDSLPAVEEVVPREELAAAARGQQAQQQVAQAAQSAGRNTEQANGPASGAAAGTADGEARGQAHQGEQEESDFDVDFDFSSGGPLPLPPEGVEPRSLEDLLAELGGAGGWEVEAGGSDSDDDGQEEGGPSWRHGAWQGDGVDVDVDGQPAAIDVEAAVAAAVAGAAQRVAQGPARNGVQRAPSAGAPVSNSSRTASGSGSASSSATTTTTGASANGAASNSSSTSTSSSSSSSDGVTSRRTVIEADAVVPPPRQPEPSSASAATAAGASGQQQSPGVDGWAMLAAEVLDVQPWTVLQPGTEGPSKPRHQQQAQQRQQHARQEKQPPQQQQQRLQQGLSSQEVPVLQQEEGPFVGSSRGRRGVTGPPAETQREAGAYGDDLDLDGLDLIDRLVAKADRDYWGGTGNESTAPPQPQQQQRQQRWAQESVVTPSIHPAGPSAGSPPGPAPRRPAPLTPGQVFPTRQQQPAQQQQQQQGQQEQQQQQQWQQPQQQQPRRPQQGGADSALLEGTPLLQRQTPRMRRRAGGLPRPGEVGPASAAGAGRIAVISATSNSNGAAASSSSRSGRSSSLPADVAGTSVGATARTRVGGGRTPSLADNQNPLVVPAAEAQQHASQQPYAAHAEQDDLEQGQVEEDAGSLLQDQEEGGHSEEGVRRYTHSITSGLSADAGGGAVAGARPMTKAELREVAAKHGLSFEQLLADAQARGIELPD
ncbi:hypothetical protein N2152v2_009592 [Parachlorella kessleri]